jgi:hypothetical protein
LLDNCAKVVKSQKLSALRHGLCQEKIHVDACHVDAKPLQPNAQLILVDSVGACRD